MLAWLYTHISLGHKGAFLFGFTTAVMLMLVFLGTIAVVWCKECLKASESSAVAKKCKGKCPKGIIEAKGGVILRHGAGGVPVQVAVRVHGVGGLVGWLVRSVDSLLSVVELAV